MQTTYTSTFKRFKFIVIATVVATLIYFAKISYEILHTSHKVVETVQNVVENAETARDISAEKTEAKTHGNSNENNKLHIVYEIFGLDVWNAKTTLKFGISARENYKTKWGNPRPNLQLKGISQLPECRKYKIIEYCILDSMVEGRIAAKALEQKYVNEHFIIFKRNPQIQHLPLPEDIFE